MNNHVIYLALLIVIFINVFNSRWIYLLVVLVAIFLLYLIKIKNYKIIVLALVLLPLFTARLVQSNKDQSNQISNLESVVVYPDDVKVNGARISGIAESDNSRFLFSYYVHSKKEQKYWKNIDNPVKLSIEDYQIEKIQRNRNIGEYNYQNYFKSKKIYQNVKIKSIRKIINYKSNSIYFKIKVLRIHIIKYLSSLPHWLRIHSNSLLIGYSDIDAQGWKTLLSTIGVIHLFSLSGMHVLILIKFLKKISSALFIEVEILDFILLLVLPFYGILAGLGTGIQRAICLAIVGILFKKFNMQLNKLYQFSLTVIICLFISPYSLQTMGGQLSFLVSFAILFIYEGDNFLKTIFRLNLVSSPVITSYTYELNILVLVYNSIFIPMFTYFILPITVIAGLTAGLHWKIWNSIDKLFGYIYYLFDKIASFKFLTIITGSIPYFVVLILISLALLIVESKIIFSKKFYLYSLIFSGVIIFNKFPIFGSVHMIDIGQGDSIVITTPFKRKTYMIDTGGKLNFNNEKWQAGDYKSRVETSTIPFLKSQGISKVDAVFLSHKDVDHIGDLDILLSKFKVSKVIYGQGLDENKLIKNIKNNHKDTEFRSVLKGGRISDSNLMIDVLWPDRPSKGENGDSLTLRTKLNKKIWLFTGDLDKEHEKQLSINKVDYLKVGHHGSKTASDYEFIKKINPELSLISSGVNNRYGHPNKETIETFNSLDIPFLNTAECGMISWYYYPFTGKDYIKTFIQE
ncbi:DNA internalization-related competence protein ComEC/Rec2 [Companilactobacillus metriopterae]|uniref:DNA internalization-related competence protein ComEC/Rec2 n=1 Tax=Companilactobacillus metriopterae TaxID=1909267 RepID=UPI00100AA319|nr:DNA internalization-related competence protein ComEC/Rec2 [Companilactobacillus metriopterae]